MTILLVANEDVDFIDSISDTSNTYIGNSIYSRSGIKTANRCVSAYFTPSTTLWLSYFSVQSVFTEMPNVLFRCTTSSSMIGVGYSALLNDETTTGLALFNGNDDDGFFLMGGEESNSLGSAGTVNRIDLYVYRYGLSNSSIIGYVNGYQRIYYSGNLVYGDGGSIDQIMINLFGTHQVFGFVVATEDTRNMYVKTLAPNAAGSFSGWTGSYTDINELPINNTTSIHTEVPDVNFQCNLTGMPGSGSYDIQAVTVAYQGIKGTDGIRMKHGFATNGQTVLSSPIDQFSFYSSTNQVYTVNPATGVAFTPSDINNLQLAFQSIA